MKSPQFFLRDEDFNDVEPVIAIRHAQADAIAHALKELRTRTYNQATMNLVTLHAELVAQSKRSK